jgi:IS30 family transposase
MNPPYTHLSLDERRELFRLRSAKIPMRVIAQRLNRHPSTLYREIKRNWFQDEEPLYRGYFHVAAHAMAHGQRARLGKLARQPALAAYVVERLQAAWSPEQIAGRLQIEPAGPGSVTHETIYAFVYSPQAAGLYHPA